MANVGNNLPSHLFLSGKKLPLFFFPNSNKFLILKKNVHIYLEAYMEDECIFCSIVDGSKPCHKFWEDEEFMAFLSIFPNTEGYSIVIPKKHYSSYAFDLTDDVLSKLIIASKKVGKKIDSKLNDVGRTGLILEGFGVDHVHAKLFPMHGTQKISKWEPIISHIDKYFEKYEGYISSHDYIRANDKDLEKLARKLSD
jgi:histidine triad (HIT) family protein